MRRDGRARHVLGVPSRRSGRDDRHGACGRCRNGRGTGHLLDRGFRSGAGSARHRSAGQRADRAPRDAGGTRPTSRDSRAGFPSRSCAYRSDAAPIADGSPTQSRRRRWRALTSGDPLTCAGQSLDQVARQDAYLATDALGGIVPAKPWRRRRRRRPQGFHPRPSRDVTTPVRASPIPPEAIPALPVGLIATRPSGLATTVRAPLRHRDGLEPPRRLLGRPTRSRCTSSMATPRIAAISPGVRGQHQRPSHVDFSSPQRVETIRIEDHRNGYLVQQASHGRQGAGGPAEARPDGHGVTTLGMAEYLRRRLLGDQAPTGSQG